MSNDNLIERGIWVNDLDGFVYADDFKTKYEPAEFFDSGDIALFNGKAVSANLLEEKGIDTLQWRWAMHQAKRRLPYFGSSQEIEQDLVRALILLCRPYAIARYAKWERVDFPSALTASLPLGLKALLSQYLSGQGLNKRQQFNGPVRDALMAAAAMTDVTAYRRTSVVQALIHEIARETVDHSGPGSLDREATRKMLSLARLHFSVAEIDLSSFAEMARLSRIYERERLDQTVAGNEEQARPGRYIRNWRLRHLRPLSDLFPFAIRHGLERGMRHVERNDAISREIALNELALAHCGVRLMQMTARWGTRK